VSGTGNTTVPTPPEDPSLRSSSPDGGRLVLCLFHAWSETQPERAGEVALLDPVIRGPGPHIFGREIDGGPGREHFFQLLPGEIIDGGPLVGQNISHEQLAIAVEGDALRVENRSSVAVKVDGANLARYASVLARPGSVIEVHGNCVLLVGLSPLSLRPAPAAFLPLHPFGQPDRIGLAGGSARMWRLRGDIAYAARSGLHALVRGDTGTGKEAVARGIHELSARAHGPYIRANAAALPREMSAYELFGSPKNVPNPGAPESIGYFGRARGGTLLLDEMGMVLEDVQATLLRALEGAYNRVGDSRPIPTGCTVVISTNQPEKVKHDLGHRLGITVETPTLAERREDIAAIVQHLLLEKAAGDSAFATAHLRVDSRGKNRVEVDASLIVGLLRSPLQGNVRDLNNILEESIKQAGSEPPLRWPGRFSLRPPAPPPADAAAVPDGAQAAPDLGKEGIERALEKHRHHMAKTATALGMTYDRLYRLRKKYGIE
jgi:transcriptional regulator with AAA-type ATPase domain